MDNSIAFHFGVDLFLLALRIDDKTILIVYFPLDGVLVV